MSSILFCRLGKIYTCWREFFLITEQKANQFSRWSEGNSIFHVIAYFDRGDIYQCANPSIARIFSISEA